MRTVLLLLATTLVAGADQADDYFEVGLDYLRKGFYSRARAAFAESLLRAPGEPVTVAFLGVAATAEGLPASTCALLLRTAHRSLDSRQALRLDLRRLLPSPRALALLHESHARRLKKARGQLRRDLLGVLAFLELQDGTPATAPSLDALLELAPKAAYPRALARMRTQAKRSPPGAQG